MHFVLLLALSASPVKLAVPSPSAVGMEPALADGVVERFATQLAAQPSLSVVSSRDIAQVLGMERQKQLLGCAESGCTAELAAALGADAILSVSFVKTEKSVSTTVRVIRASNGVAIAQDTHRGADIEATQDWLDGIVVGLAKKIREGLGVVDVAPVAAPSRPLAPWIVGGIGAAAIVGGAVSLYFSNRDAMALSDASVPPLPMDQIDTLQRNGQLGQTLGIVLIAAGGAAVVTGTVLWLVAPKAQTKVALVPTAGGAFFSMSGAF